MDDSFADNRDFAIRTKRFTITDHNGDEVSIAWYTKNDCDDRIPPFPFQVYVLGSAEQVAKDEEFSRDFAAFIQKNGPVNSRAQYHFQIYRRSFPNILACVAHQRREIHHRNRNGITPHVLARWTTTGTGDKGRIIIIDTNDWIKGDVLLVGFDPAEYDNRAQWPLWNFARAGDIDLVHARRFQSTNSFIQSLEWRWRHAGGSWTENDLQRRNEGGTSPVLYPAIDPAAHYDAEHEEIHELDGTALPGLAGQGNEDDDDDDDDDNAPRIIDTFDPFDLLLQEHTLKGYHSEAYSDVLGLPVTSIWDGKLSRLRPRFSFTLYLAFDFVDKLQVHPKAIFHCLNKDLVAQEPWTLDVVKNMPSLDAAFQYHARAMAQRTSERCEQRRACVHFVLLKVAGSRLPHEILEYIEDILLPPEIPRYSGLPIRAFQSVFLYLDKSRQYTGPLIVYSDPIDRSVATEYSDSEHSYRSEPTFGSKSVLRVVYQRYWHRVADELHILWSLCSPRNIEIADSTVPRAELELTAPEACVWRSQFGIQFINGYPDVKMTLHSDREIVVPCHVGHGGLFSHDLWLECVDTIDLATGDVLASLPPEAHVGPICFNSWAQTRELGFKAGAGGFVDPDENFRDFKANETYPLRSRPPVDWWRHQVRHGKLKSGRRYAFRLRPGITIPRWTYGTIRNREGPFNLPPIPITVDETLRPFEFRVESIGAPHGSFSR